MSEVKGQLTKMKKNSIYRILSLSLALSLLLGVPVFAVRADGEGVAAYSKVATAQNCAFAIKVDNSLWGWGANFSGQVGDGSTNMRLSSAKIMDDVASVSTSGISTYAVKTDGSLWAWGSNTGAQLGDGTTRSSLVPKWIMDGIASVSAGGNCAHVVKTDGSLWAWGNNGSGRLGDGTTTSRTSPVHIMDDVRSVVSGFDHVLAIKTDGSLWAWGYNSYGQVGDGSTTNRLLPVKVLDGVVHAAAGDGGSMATKTDGSLWAWGNNSYSRFSADAPARVLTPIKIMDGVNDMAFGSQFALFVKTDGSLWSCGYNSFGQLGDGTTVNRRVPVKVLDSVSCAAAGLSHSLAVKSDGSLWGWGSDSYGQMGDGTGTNNAFPVPAIVNMTDIGKMAAGSAHSMALKTDKSLWIWGDNTQGQLGDGTTRDRAEPRKVLDDAADMAGGSSHTLAVQTNGNLWAWGYNSYGQVGNNSTSNQRTPVLVLGDVLKVACGDYHSLAIKKDGSLWAWGSGTSGQLGNGGTENSRVPIKIMDNVKDAAAGYLHTVIVKTDGSLWTWGYNYSGQLGNGSTANNPVPQKIFDKGVVGIAAATNRTQALMDDGSLWVWGDNSYGQVGDGTTTQRSTPVKVLDNVSKVTSGGLRTYAITNESTLLGWGAGPVGDGRDNSTARTRPAIIMEDAADVFIGYRPNFVMLNDGSLWSWGGNTRYSLGYDDTIPRRLMPEGSILAYEPGEPISIRDITSVTINGIVEPVAGDWPFGVSNVKTPDSGYGITAISWSPDAPDSFEFSVEYSATITLTSRGNYRFVDGVLPVVNAGFAAQPGTVSGGDAPGNMLVFTVSFAATGAPSVLTVSAPVADPMSGTTFADSLTIALSAETGIASIYYTLDGSDPSSGAGMLYSEPITITETTTIRATAVISDRYFSEVAMFAYTHDPETIYMQEGTPEAAIDFMSERLTGLVPNSAYTVNGSPRTSDGACAIAIEEPWLGATARIVKAGVPDDFTVDSEAQALSVPSRPAAPAGIGKTDTTGGNSNGTITGVDSSMEYRSSGADSWSRIDSTELSELAAGIYYVRTRATENAFASFTAGATIASSTAGANDGRTGSGGGGGGGGAVAAIGEEEVPLSNLSSYADELYALGLFRGTGVDENGLPIFSLDEPLTRFQALVLTIRLLGLEDEALSFAGDNPFVDVTYTLNVPYVAFAYDRGITKGISDTAFGPSRLVTCREFTTFLLRILGYSDDDGGEFTFAGALDMALEIGLYTNGILEGFSEDALLRGDAVVAMVRALLTRVNNSEDTLLIDTLVEEGIFSGEEADAFIEAIARIDAIEA